MCTRLFFYVHKPLAFCTNHIFACVLIFKSNSSCRINYSNVVSCVQLFIVLILGEVFDYLVAHGRMKEKEARAKFRQVKDFL